MAYTQVVPTHYTGSQRWREQSRRGCAFMHTSTKTQSREYGVQCGEFRTDYDPILVHSRGPNDACTCDHGNPSAGTARRRLLVACMNDAEVLDGPLWALDSHEFRAADGIGGCHGVCIAPLSQISSRRPISLRQPNQRRQRRSPKPDRHSRDEGETQRAPPPDGNGNTLFVAGTSLNTHLIALHAALLQRTTLLIFSVHRDPSSVTLLVIRQTEYQAS
ncbi:hypothetical protein EDB83DRAFT_2391313 [Lactarius deliciosus]|nr:hypothetical protein EDB83DRAFT_2391313 [Lactarius deliciosus]